MKPIIAKNETGADCVISEYAEFGPDVWRKLRAIAKNPPSTVWDELPVIRTLRGIDINVLGKEFLIQEIQKELKARPAIDMGLDNEMLQKCSNVTLFELLVFIYKIPLGDK